MNSSKFICVVGPCLKMGGIERSSSNIANGLSRMGFKVVYIAIFRQEQFFKLDENVIFDEPDQGQNETRLSILSTISRIRERVKFYKPDVILVFNKFYSALVALGTFRLGIPYFLSERSSPFFKWPLKLEIVNRIAFALNAPRGVMAQTKIAATYQAQYYSPKTRITVIPNMLDYQDVPEPELENPQILAVGRLNDHLKGFDRLIKAMKFVNPSWNLKIVGAEKKITPLHKLILEERLQDRIILEPKSADLKEHYSKSSIFVIPSRSEGFPNALIEAMAAGLPPVSYNFVAGPDEIIENEKSGLLVKEGDIQGLADAINKLAANHSLRKKIGALAQTSKERYSSDRICTQIAQFLGVL